MCSNNRAANVARHRPERPEEEHLASWQLTSEEVLILRKMFVWTQAQLKAGKLRTTGRQGKLGSKHGEESQISRLVHACRGRKFIEYEEESKCEEEVQASITVPRGAKQLGAFSILRKLCAANDLEFSQETASTLKKATVKTLFDFWIEVIKVKRPHSWVPVLAALLKCEKNLKTKHYYNTNDFVGSNSSNLDDLFHSCGLRQRYFRNQLQNLLEEIYAFAS